MNKKLGQYFTKNEELLKNIYKFIKNNPDKILEPSIGQGHIVNYIKSKIENVEIKMIEIDKNIEILEGINKEEIVYNDFIELDFKNKFKTIIGNPPYVKKKGTNLYIQFIEKCYNLLEEGGELIFIIPSDFFKLTSAIKIINIMINNGNFTDIYHPNNDKLFEDACIDILIFRYEKSQIRNNNVNYNDNIRYIEINNGTINFINKINEDYKKLSDYVDIYVGMVSGNENILRNEEYGNKYLLISEEKKEKYIILEDFPTKDEKLNNYMLENKIELINRKVKKIDENNWYEFGLLRNKKIIESNINKDCLYMYNLTRKINICFKSKVQYFGGNLLMIIPKKDINIDLDKLCEYFNKDEFKERYLFSNRFKINHKNLKDSYIPYK